MSRLRTLLNKKKYRLHLEGKVRNCSSIFNRVFRFFFFIIVIFCLKMQCFFQYSNHTYFFCTVEIFLKYVDFVSAKMFYLSDMYTYQTLNSKTRLRFSKSEQRLHSKTLSQL